MSEAAFLEESLLMALILGREEEAGRLAGRCDWQRVAQIAERDLIGGYLHRSLESTGLGRFAPPSFLQAMAAAHRKTTFDNLLLLGRLREAAAALSQAKVPFIVLKGGALLADLYPDPGTRALTDLDLLVPAPLKRMAQSAIEDLGWRRTEDTQVAARRCGYETPGPGICLLEIHWDLSQRYRFQADVDRIWKEALPLQLDGISGARMGHADEYVYLALHYAAHYFGLTVKWLIDLIELTRRRPPDWEAVHRRARDWHGTSALHAALLFVRKNAPELVPPEALAGHRNHLILDRALSIYETRDPLRFLREMRRGPARLFLATLLQDRIRDRIALAWLTMVRGHRDDED